MSTTFTVDPVEIGKLPSSSTLLLLPKTPFEELLNKGEQCVRTFENGKWTFPTVTNNKIPSGVEACMHSHNVLTLDYQAWGKDRKGTSSRVHGLMQTINLAYDHHLPLTLSPDHIWTAIAQAFAQHISIDPEKYRHQFVQHEGKQELVVRCDGFVKGSNLNDWAFFVKGIVSQIKEHVGEKKHNLLMGGYSTTGEIERTVAGVTLMDTMKGYFDYTCMTRCGIPFITLLGTTEDWSTMRKQVQALGEFGLAKWVESLDRVLLEFVKATSGTVNRKFWQNIFKFTGRSGGPFITGWVNVLMPYTVENKVNKLAYYTYPQTDTGYGGLTTSDYTTGISEVPFKWEYYEQEFQMNLFAGFTGTCLHNDTLMPTMGWAVAER